MCAQHRHLAACWLSAALLAACAAPATDRVTLLPGEHGRATGGLVVQSPRAELLLNQPYAQATVAADGQVQAATTTAEAVKARYGGLLAQQPPRPRLWVVYFESGSNRLTGESERVLAELQQAWAAQPASELVLTGHTDSVGAQADNDQLSLQRAQALRDSLLAMGFEAARVTAAGRGERELLVPTADEVAEPRNRRVEIKLR